MGVYAMEHILWSMEFSNIDEVKKEISLIGSTLAGVNLMAPKGVLRCIKVKELSTKAANILKQELLAKGGDCATSWGSLDLTAPTTDVLCFATEKVWRQVIPKLKMQPFGLKSLAEEIEEVLKNLNGRPKYELDCRGRKITLGERTLIMGILNVTPDSFSDGGQYNDIEAAVKRARQMVAEGADIIDVGGESTRPGAEYVPAEEELRRVLPVVEALVREINVPISVDTYKAEVAEKALEAGAHIINDVWGLQKDPRMAEVAARYGAPVVVMHNKTEAEYDDLMAEVIAFLKESIKIGVKAGIPREKIIIDPGIGFGKTLEHNLLLMKRLNELNSLGQPILLGTSRKSMIGKTLDLPVNERVEGTAATVTLGIAKGVDIVRVHDVKEMVRVAKMTDAMVR